MPFVVGDEAEKKEIYKALSLETISSELEKTEPYIVDVDCENAGT